MPEKKHEVTAIAAIGRNRELGIGNRLIWRLSGDLARFKELTTGFPVVMGRKTFESIGKPLPNRTNIVVTRDTGYRCGGCTVVHSVEEALEVAARTGAGKTFIIGGGEIYGAALPYTTRLELTRIDAEEARADVFFPPFEKEFEEVHKEQPREENGVSYMRVSYKRKVVDGMP